tara:strand:- start:330 stop:674 length:345 start_codon:yes stop_codon:yes gene_type:complete
MSIDIRDEIYQRLSQTSNQFAINLILARLRPLVTHRWQEKAEYSEKCIEILEEQLEKNIEWQMKRIQMFGEEGQPCTLEEQKDKLKDISRTIKKINRLIREHSIIAERIRQGGC